MICSFQPAVPPQKIKNSLKQKFPSAENIRWYKIGPSDWEADFILGGKKATASFTLDARWFKSTLEITPQELIEEVKFAVKRDHPGCEIISAVITEDKIITWYFVKMKCKNEILESSYDYHGMSYPPKI